MLRTAARRAAALASSSACRTPVPAAPFSSAPVNIYSERIASPGAADGPTPDTRTMCVVHGVLGTGRNLATLTRKLVTAGEAISGHPWQAVLVDQRCHGKSGALGLPPPHTLASSARDILRLFDEGGVGYATRMDVLIGHSLGGKVSLEITRQLVDAGRPPLQVFFDGVGGWGCECVCVVVGGNSGDQTGPRRVEGMHVAPAHFNVNACVMGGRRGSVSAPGWQRCGLGSASGPPPSSNTPPPNPNPATHIQPLPPPRPRRRRGCWTPGPFTPGTHRWVSRRRCM